jgi:hypothetical protein
LAAEAASVITGFLLAKSKCINTAKFALRRNGLPGEKSKNIRMGVHTLVGPRWGTRGD